MNLYISDLHFGHKNAISFDHRPFGSVEEMDRAMIYLWNSRVSKDDSVYIVGDICYKSEHSPEWYLRQLKGRKHLVIGNHDKVVTDSPAAMACFESVDKLMFITDGDRLIQLCHFPLAEWNKQHHGAWHIYGHIHGSKTETYEYMKTKERALNAAACINNYTPASFGELVRNNSLFKKEDRDGMLLVATDRETGEKFMFNSADFGRYVVRPAFAGDRNLPVRELQPIPQTDTEDEPEL